MRSSWRAPLTGLAVLGLVLAGCGGGGQTETSAQGKDQISVTIGWTPPDITGVFKTATKYFKKSAKQASKHGMDVEVIARSPATHTAYADQVGIIEDFISQGVDVIAVSPSAPEAIKPALQQANEAGIPIIMVNLLREQKDIDVASYIGFDNEEAARVTAYSVVDYFGGPGVLGAGKKVDVEKGTYLDLEWWKKLYQDSGDVSVESTGGVFIEGIAGTFFTRERTKGFTDVLGQYPNVEILAKPLPADWNREKAIKVAENYLSRLQPAPKGELDFIWGESGEMAIGAMTAAQRAGVLDTSGGSTPPKPGTVAIFSNDVTPESVSYIKEGTIIAETHHGFAEWGWFGTEFAVKIACGLDVPKFKDIRPRTVWEGNADRFYPNPELPDTDWEKIGSQCQAGQ